MAKPNYSYEKRQKELARKKKKEEKRLKKQTANRDVAADDEAVETLEPGDSDPTPDQT